MDNEKKLRLLDAVLEDFRAGLISHNSTVEVIFSIFQGLGKVTKEHIDWAKNVIDSQPS